MVKKVHNSIAKFRHPISLCICIQIHAITCGVFYQIVFGKHLRHRYSTSSYMTLYARVVGELRNAYKLIACTKYHSEKFGGKIHIKMHKQIIYCKQSSLQPLSQCPSMHYHN
uniref:Uncharacterized protein n=1 Tax=Glossina austeni TaxID=7395 RepID=A0A1A9UJG3_GLOAU